MARLSHLALLRPSSSGGNSAPAFQHALVADWSARARPAPARPARDAIWWSATWLDGPRYCRTQHQAEEQILAALSAAPGPVLAGFDFCFALPAWAMHRLGGWHRVWQLLEPLAAEGPEHAARQFNHWLGGGKDGPFWGLREMPCKPRPYLWTEFRECELQLKRRGLHPKPVFQLRGAGAVGAQSILGIASLERLRRALGARVWPFENPAGARVVFAEVWPALLGSPPADEEIPDRWQVQTLALRLPGVPLRETPAEARVEGWVLEPGGPAVRG